MADTRWKELLVWTFRGDRFEEDGIDISDLESLVQLRRILVDVARVICRRRARGKQAKLLKDGSDVEVRIFGFEKGSCKIHVYYAQGRDAQQSLFRQYNHLSDALPESALLTAKGLRAILHGSPMPRDFPSQILPQVKNLTKRIRPHESVSIDVPTEVRVVHSIREPLAAKSVGVREPQSEYLAPDQDGLESVVLDETFVDRAQERKDEVTSVYRTITGEVTMASLKGKASMTVAGREVQLEFKPEQEAFVTTALKDHSKVQLRVRGLGELDLRSTLLRKLYVHDVRIVPKPEPDVLGESLFERWAINEPTRLLEAMQSGELRPTLLTYAAEIAGKRLGSSTVVAILLSLLTHDAAIVREGAVYGLSYHTTFMEVVDVLRRVATEDPSPGVRSAASDVIQDLFDGMEEQ